MFRKFLYGRMMSVFRQLPYQTLVDMGLETQEAQEQRAREVAYD